MNGVIFMRKISANDYLSVANKFAMVRISLRAYLGKPALIEIFESRSKSPDEA